MVLVKNVIDSEGRQITDYELEKLIRDFDKVLLKNKYKAEDIRLVSSKRLRFKVVLHGHKKPHVSPYLNSPNYTVNRNKDGELEAVNIYIPSIRNKIKNLRYLQLEDWVKFNDLINEYFNKKNLSADIETCELKIRIGKDDKWITRYEW